MVKKAVKRPRGRPVFDEEDRRTERIAIRCHPDLVEQLNQVSRQEGLVRSVLIERVLIAYLNSLPDADVQLDLIGRAIPPDEMVRRPTGLAALRDPWTRLRGVGAFPEETNPRRRRRDE